MLLQVGSSIYIGHSVSCSNLILCTLMMLAMFISPGQGLGAFRKLRNDELVFRSSFFQVSFILRKGSSIYISLILQLRLQPYILSRHVLNVLVARSTQPWCGLCILKRTERFFFMVFEPLSSGWEFAPAGREFNLHWA